jgi:hypothetical protein
MVFGKGIKFCSSAAIPRRRASMRSSLDTIPTPSKVAPDSGDASIQGSLKGMRLQEVRPGTKVAASGYELKMARVHK